MTSVFFSGKELIKYWWSPKLWGDDTSIGLTYVGRVGKKKINKISNAILIKFQKQEFDHVT